MHRHSSLFQEFITRQCLDGKALSGTLHLPGWRWGGRSAIKHSDHYGYTQWIKLDWHLAGRWRALLCRNSRLRFALEFSKSIFARANSEKREYESGCRGSLT